MSKFQKYLTSTIAEDNHDDHDDQLDNQLDKISDQLDEIMENSLRSLFREFIGIEFRATGKVRESGNYLRDKMSDFISDIEYEIEEGNKD